MDTLDFLQRVITTPEGWMVLATYDDKKWKENWFKWPTQAEEIVDESTKHSCDVYFSSYLFEAASSKKAVVLPSRTIQADLDNADPYALELSPTVLVQTSRNRYQGYWLLDKALPLPEHEALSKQVAYSIPLCDRSGWTLGHKVRLPNTNNCKYGDSQLITVVHETNRTYTRSEMLTAFEYSVLSPADISEDQDDFLQHPMREFTIGPQELLNNLREKLPPKVLAQYNEEQQDRSAAIWALMCALFRAGCNRYEVYYLASKSKNNKFADLHINAERELAKDVLRAEKAGITNPREVIDAVRTLRLPPAQIKRVILETVVKVMKDLGTFVRTSGGEAFFVYQGQPITISFRSSPLNAFLENVLGLNYTEAEQHYVVNGLISYCAALPTTINLSALSQYDPRNNTMFLHTGRKQVLKITDKSITPILNGSDGWLFQWHSDIEPFLPMDGVEDWASELFGDSVNDVALLSRTEALALLKVWFLFLLFRHAAEARPILAIFGQPGSGKSAIARRVHAVLYGSRKKLGSITNRSDFDTQTSNFPFVVFDNVDTWENWLPDSLAQVINDTDVVVRSLYTNNDTFTKRRQAMVALTAHDPKFGRADVVDRLLIIDLKRVPVFRDEYSMVRHILEQRNYLWGAIIDDVQRVIRTPLVRDNSLQFRIQDFATLGLWIAKALGIEEDFRNAVIAIKRGQKAFVLEDEAILVDALFRAVKRDKIIGKEVMIADIWAELELVSPDPIAFAKRYRNAALLARKLHTLQDPLSVSFKIKWRDDENSKRLWLITLNEES